MKFSRSSLQKFVSRVIWQYDIDFTDPNIYPCDLREKKKFTIKTNLFLSFFKVFGIKFFTHLLFLISIHWIPATSFLFVHPRAVMFKQRSPFPKLGFGEHISFLIKVRNINW